MTSNLNYRDLVNKETFIGQYLQHYENIETAQQFDFWSAVWLLSNAVNRNVLINRPMAPLRLNWYIVLVSDPGVGRKSTAIGHAATVLAHANADLPFDNPLAIPRLFNGSATPEQFEQILGSMQQAKAAIAVGEMARFIGLERYKMGLVPLLVDLYDCPDEQQVPGTKNKGGYVLSNVYISMLTGCTPEWLSSAVSPAVLEGGFVSRTMFIIADANKDMIAWPSEADHKDFILKSNSYLKEQRLLAEKDGTVDLSPGARNAFSTWYTHRKGSDTTFLRHFESREHDHVLRMATVLCINDGTWEVQPQHIHTAVKIIEHEKRSASDLFVDGDVKEIKAATGIERLRDHLFRALPDHIGHRALYVKVRQWMTIDEFKSVITGMHELGMIEVYQDSNTRGRYYKATRQITGAAKLQTLVRRVSKAS